MSDLQARWERRAEAEADNAGAFAIAAAILQLARAIEQAGGGNLTHDGALRTIGNVLDKRLQELHRVIAKIDERLNDE